MKCKWVVVLIISLIVAACLGFFIYKKIEDSKYVEVKFIDGFNNEVLSTQKLEVGESAEVPEVPKHVECEFKGWYKEDDTKVEDFTKIEEDLIVYSSCESYTYSVRFYDTIAKKVVDTQKVKYGGSAVAPAAPGHFGYIFVGWRGKFSFIKSNITISAIYEHQKGKYAVKYYTLDESGNEKLYATKTYSGYVNRYVSAKIISIGGYKLKSNYSKNKLTGKVDIDNSLVLKVYYEPTTYKVSVNGEENEYNYKDKITLPSITKTVTLSYEENDAVINKLSSNTVEPTLKGYCKNSKTCKSSALIKPGTVVTVTGDAKYYPVWVMDLNLILPAGEGYELDSETYDFAKWYFEDNNYNAGTSFTFTEDTTLIAVYKKGSLDESNTKKYVVNTYYDEEIHSSLSYDGIVGEEILGIRYAKEISGYTIDSYTRSIFVSENVSENVINVYYISNETSHEIEYTAPLFADEEMLDESEIEGLEATEEITDTEEETEVIEEVTDTEEETEVTEEVTETEEETEVTEEVTETEEETEVTEEVTETEEETEVAEEVTETEEETEVAEEVTETEEETEVTEEVTETNEETEKPKESLEVKEKESEEVTPEPVHIDEKPDIPTKNSEPEKVDVAVIEAVENNKEDSILE